MQRRTLLTSAASGLAAIAGCISTRASENDGGTPTDRSPAALGQIAAVTVSEFITYPLSGTHPHVHRQANTQYVVVRVDTPMSAETAHRKLTLTLDGETVPQADRQPVPWQTDTVDVAFAVSKDVSAQEGEVRFAQTARRSLSEATLTRLNSPPMFAVTDLSLTPTELQSDERARATIEFTVTNTGEGRGTFGASLSGNFLSGSEKVTVTLDAGSERTITGSTKVIGEGKEATVQLDWGSDSWSKTIPVSETPTKTDATTDTADNTADEDDLTEWESATTCEKTPTGMYDSVIKVTQVVTDLSEGYVPIRFSELTSAEKSILRTVTEEGGYATCETSDGFLRFIERVGTHRDEQSETSAEDMHIYLEREGTYYRLYVEKLDEAYAY